MTSAKQSPSQNLSASHDETISEKEATKVGEAALNESADSESELLEKWSKFAAAFAVSETKPIRVSSLDSLRQKK